MVGSPSGKVADCNSALASSTLAPTSKYDVVAEWYCRELEAV